MKKRRNGSGTPLNEEDARWLRNKLLNSHVVPGWHDMDWQDREDLVQKTMLQTCEAAKRGQIGRLRRQMWREAVRHFALTILKRRAHDHFRRQNTKFAKNLISLDALAGTTCDEEENAPDKNPAFIDHAARCPARCVEELELWERCIAALQQLDKTAQAIIRLKLASDSSDREVARALGLSPRGVGKALARARKTPEMQNLRKMAKTVHARACCCD